MSFLDRPSVPSTFKPPTAVKRSVAPQRVTANPSPMGMGGGIGNNNGGHMDHHNRNGNGPHRPGPIGPAGIAPLGAAPVGLSPGLGPSNPALLVMPTLVSDTPMSMPIAKERSIISEESIRTRMYTHEEFMSLRGECSNTPSAVLEWVLGMYRTDGGVGGLRCPPHLRLLVDELEADRTGALLGGAGRKNARPVRAVHHKVMSILSRLTPQKYDLLKEELFQLPLRQLSDGELREVVKVFFNKSVQEHKFSDLYAHMVADICTVSESEAALDQATRERLLQTRMRSELLTACQDEFNRPLQLTEKDRVDPITGEPLPEEEISRKREILKTRLVGNIKFVGELYKFNLVNPRVVNSIFRILVFDFDPAAPTAKEDYMFEVFGMLLKTVGDRISREDPQNMAEVMKKVIEIQTHHTGNRVKFGMMDLCDLHQKGWQVKKQVLTQQEHENAQIEKTARDNATLERQKAQLRGGGASSSNLSTPVSQMDPSKFGGTPLSGSKRPLAGLGASSAATPVNGGRSFPAAAGSSVSSSPLAAGAPNYATVAGRKVPGANATITTTTTTSRTGGAPAPPSAAGGASAASSSAAPAAARSGPSSVNPSPMASVSRESAKEMATRLMKDFNAVPNRPRVLQGLADLERNVCIPVITTWIREAVINTRLFEERDNLCQLFFAIVERCEEPSSMILSSSDLLTTVLEWLRFDISQARFNECPRLFANWAAVVNKAYRTAVSVPQGPDHAKNRSQWMRVLSILSCSTFTLSLREIITNEFRSTIVTAIRDMNAVAASVIKECDVMAGHDPQKILHFAAMARFRLLPYVIKADEGDKIRVPYTPSLGPAPTAAPIGMGSADPYHQCFQIQQDDAELTFFKRVVRRDTNYSAIITSAFANISQNQNVSRIVTTMKLTAATLSLLNPPTGEKPLISEKDAYDILADVIQRNPNPLQSVAQAAVVMEMICFYCSNTNKLLGIGGTPSLSAIPSTPGKSTRDESFVALSATADTFRRWCEAGVVDRSSVLSVLQSVAPMAVPSTPGTPPRMSSAALDAMDSSFSLPEPSHRVATPLMGASTSSCPSTPQMTHAGGQRGGAAAASFRFDMCEMLVRNMNFVSSLRWSNVINQLQK